VEFLTAVLLIVLTVKLLERAAFSKYIYKILTLGKLIINLVLKTCIRPDVAGPQ